MRFDADWMSRADDRILEHLAEEGPDTPKEMADSDRVRFSRQHINARCKTLVTYGLLVHLGNGVYDITQKGKQYLAGELDARDLEALAADRRRTALAVLSDQYHPITTETLARDVAAREADTTERGVSRERVDEVLASLVHVHLPVLHDATLVGYDDDADRVSYEGHPVVRAEWIRPDAGVSATDAETTAGDAGTGRTDVRTLEGRETIIATGQSLCERADDELFLLFTTTGLLEEGCFRRIEEAVDRGVDVTLGSRDPRVRDIVRERVPDVELWEPQVDWLTLPPEGESVGRLVFADREAVMIGTLGRPAPGDDAYTETALVGDGPDNGLVVLMRQMLGSRLDELDGERADRQSQFPL